MSGVILNIVQKCEHMISNGKEFNEKVKKHLIEINLNEPCKVDPNTHTLTNYFCSKQTRKKWNATNAVYQMMIKPK